MSTTTKSTALRFVRKYYPDVKEVIDSTRGTKVTVTKRDCENAVGKEPNLCAIAKAAMRRWDGAIVSLSRAYLIRGRTAHRYEIPSHVGKELIVFDRSHSFMPGVYELSKVRPAQRLGKRPSGTTKHIVTGKHTKNRKHFTQGVRSLVKERE